MGFNILELQPNRVSCDLTSYNFLLYSDPGVGKTTFATQLFPKRSIILGAEYGYKGIDGAIGVPVPDYLALTDYCNQLDTKEAREMYDTIIVDTTTRIGEIIENYILSDYDQKTIGDCKPHGGAYPIINRMYNKVFNKLKARGYNFVYICHSQVENGFYRPKMSDRINGLIAPEVDFIFCLANVNGQRILITDTTNVCLGKNRLNSHVASEKLPVRMELNADVFKEHFEKCVKSYKNYVEDKKESSVMSFKKVRNYKKVLNDIQSILKEINNDEDKMNKALNMVNNLLGVDENNRQRTLENANQENIEVLELVLYKLNLIKNNKYNEV